jgi:hypothetical protein
MSNENRHPKTGKFTSKRGGGRKDHTAAGTGRKLGSIDPSHGDFETDVASRRTDVTTGRGFPYPVPRRAGSPNTSAPRPGGEIGKP